MKNTTGDALLDCLVTFTALYHEPHTATSLIDGLPTQEGYGFAKLFSTDQTSSNFSRAAKRAGLISKVVHKELEEISNLMLPCIITLKNNSACILESIDEDQKKAKVIYPELPDSQEWISLEKLNEDYLGFAFLLKKKYSYDTLDTHYEDKSAQHWFWSTLRHSKSIYRNVILASIVINLFILATPLFTMNIYDRVLPNNAIETLWALSIGVILIFIFDIILKFLRTYFLEFAGQKSDIIMSSKIFEKVMSLQMANKPQMIGSFASQLKEYESVRNFLTSSTLVTLIDVPFGIIFLTVTFFIAGKIVIVPVVIIMIIIIYSLIMKKPLHAIVKSSYEAVASKNAILIEALTNFEAIKTMSASGYSQLKWENATQEIAKKTLNSRTLYNSIITFTSFLLQVNTVTVLIVGVYMVRDMELSMGGLVATVILTSRAIAPMGQVAALIINYEEFSTSLTNLNEIMQLPVDRPQDKKFIHVPDMNGTIEFNDVTFTYPGNKVPTLKNVSFTLKKGEKVGIIGKNGSGKTTIEKLILNIYQPDSGFISIDNIDVREIDPADLRKQIAYVPQESTLFRGTLRSNIVYKRQTINDERILEASRIGLVDQFVKSHPLGYDMPIGEQGYGLSGGQKRAITIAQAFIEKTPIVLMDEPTNAMDNGMENLFIQRIRKEIQGKTTLLVSHKFNLMELVDRLILLDGGKVILDDTKETVLQALKTKK